MDGTKSPETRVKIKVSMNGPYTISGKPSLFEQIIIPNAEGDPYKWRKGKKYRPSEKCTLCRCGKSSRLVVWDKKTKKALEPNLEQSIGFVEDPQMGVSGPIWVRGCIPIESTDGKLYTVRNRVTLCRCGKSMNKPFCDSSHYPEEHGHEENL